VEFVCDKSELAFGLKAVGLDVSLEISRGQRALLAGIRHS